LSDISFLALLLLENNGHTRGCIVCGCGVGSRSGRSVARWTAIGFGDYSTKIVVCIVAHTLSGKRVLLLIGFTAARTPSSSIGRGSNA